MIRVVLVVLLAVALLAASTPALEDARRDTTVERLGTEADRVERVAGGVTADSVAVVDPSLAARTSVVVTAPTGFAAAPIERLAIAEPTRTEAASATRLPDGTVVLVYRLRHGPLRAIPVPPPTDAVGLSVAGGRIELRPRGRTALDLRLIRDGGPTVRIGRVDRTG